MGQERLERFPVRALVVALIGALVLVGVVACGEGEVTPTPTPVDHVAEGKQLFIAKGCVGCHGANAEGTDIAPALPGHSEEEVKRTVRNPVGSMPRFDSETISDDELELIAGYIGSLQPADGHREPVAMEDALVMHHWMALYALESDNMAEAAHHVQHIIELITDDPEHKAQMEEVLGQVQAGELHDATHAIEEMLTGKADPQLTMKVLHLRLALADLQADDPASARHHIEHFIELATDNEKALGDEILELLEQGNIHDAEHEVEELLSNSAG